MSITNSLYIGISGLQAHGDAIGIVGDNIANTSTVGFKRARASFADLLGGELGSQRLGGGVRLGASQMLYDQGAIMQTGNPLDVAISGRGMFVVKGNHAGQAGQFYTRDGRFQLDNQGFVVDPRGLRLQGFAIDNGVRATSIGDLPLGARQSPPVATTNARLTLNLDGDALPPAAFDPLDPTATSNFPTSITIYDSLGKPHNAEVYFRAQGGGAWEWHALVDGGELTGGTAGTGTEIASGTLAFDTNGLLQTQTTAASSANFVGAAPGQAVAFDFGDDIASGGTGRAGTTQFAAAGSTETAVAVDGHGFGNLTDLEIADDGTIAGIFDNGDRIALAQLALADFPADEQLARLGDGLLHETSASGAPLLEAPGTGARGALVSGALEGSNVDLGSELVTLIAYQRAFQANAKTVTTADEMMAEVASLKR
jgi:flagellar hook protein FlgE